MRNTATGLFLGIFLGALGVILVSRIREALHEDDIDTLTERLTEQLDQLEHRTHVVTA